MFERHFIQLGHPPAIEPIAFPNIDLNVDHFRSTFKILLIKVNTKSLRSVYKFTVM